MMTKRRALISVSDKTDVIQLAQELVQLDFELISTGGTSKQLMQNNIQHIEVSELTEFPEIMGGRVKTLHPKIHGGILARRGIDDEIAKKHQITPISLVVVNLYPFEQTIQDPNCVFSDAIENIDIGGPTLIRAAAKNHKDVLVVVEPKDYKILIDSLRQDAIDEQLLFDFAKKAFAHTANYDATIANYLGTLDKNHTPKNFPDTLTCQFSKKQVLRYGENPHQNAAFYTERNPPSGSITNALQLHGKELSFNNIADADAALECVKSFSKNKHTCVIVKHANPCGIASCDTQTAAYKRAFLTDPTSSFGGIIAFNQSLTANTVTSILDKQFVEVIIAPFVEKEALTLLSKKKNIRVLACGDYSNQPQFRLDYKRVNGGILIQEYDDYCISEKDLEVVTQTKPTSSQLADLLFAWNAVKYVKSNAIVFVKNLATLAIGAGQMSRVYSTKIAQAKAQDEGLSLNESVLASDAFFPFKDSIETAANAGVKAIIQPGGSIRDAEVVTAANKAKIAMVFTGIRHFRH
jgi:phosphoribosylaminoimidazolecarboxamide formyltransferase / IMP cyclohydrolase